MDEAARVVRAAATEITGAANDYDALIDLIGDKRFVLLGEASHGSAEFYRERARITRRLVEDAGFTAVAVEADWPDAYRANCYVRAVSGDPSAVDALGGFVRFPRWMWRNVEVVALLDWLRGHNARQPFGAARVGFYGLDLYSLHASARAVVDYLEQVDPRAAATARERYACFDHTGESDGQAYGRRAAFGAGPDCEDEVVAQLSELRRQATQAVLASDEAFHAVQNARVVAGAEQYYRTMFHGRVSSWNLRDTHMTDTLDALAAHLGRESGSGAKIVVWAHNSHLGDARATGMGWSGEHNVGQLVRERHPDDCVLVGFTTYAGTVTAASDWDRPAERKTVNPGLAGSWEDVLHSVGLSASLLRLDQVGEALTDERLERYIGVVYRPQTERFSHYVESRLGEQYDALVHIDVTSAMQPLEAWYVAPADDLADDLAGDVAETFPTGT